MPRHPLLLALILAFSLGAHARAQELARLAENLQATLRVLEQEVAQHVPKDAGRGAVLHDLEETRGSLQHLKDGVLSRSSRGEVASSVYASRKNLDRALNVLDREANRPNLHRFVVAARGQMSGVELQLNGYVPAAVGRAPAGPPPANLDDRAQTLTVNYLADRFRISRRSIEITRFTQDGNKYRVYARMPGLGSYAVTLDALGGSIFSADPVR